MTATDLSLKALLDKVEYLEHELARMREEKTDLEILLETTTAHSDIIEAQLYDLNQRLQAEIQERQRVETALQASTTELSSLLSLISKDKEDLEILLETTVQHGDTIEALLHDAETKYRSIFESAIQGIAQITLDGRYLSANQALAGIYGYESPDALLRDRRDIQDLYVHEMDRERLLIRIQQQGTLANFEALVRRQDGHPIWTVENACLVKNRQGQPLYFVSVVEDITERKQAELALRLEKEKSERLLLNILPKVIVDQLKHRKRNSPAAIAKRFDMTTILFADIVNFTPLASALPPAALVDLLNQIFSQFDHLAEAHGLEKIKTVGDAYMVAGGLPIPQSNHAEAVADMALEMLEAISQFQRVDHHPFQLRIGIHTGSVIAGVIGIRKFIYDLWGDAVNVASRMESQGLPQRIQVSAASWQLLNTSYRFEQRGRIQVKGKRRDDDLLADRQDLVPHFGLFPTSSLVTYQRPLPLVASAPYLVFQSKENSILPVWKVLSENRCLIRKEVLLCAEEITEVPAIPDLWERGVGHRRPIVVLRYTASTLPPVTLLTERLSSKLEG